MKKYITKRVITSVFILFFVGLIIYTLLRSLPTSYIENMARQKSMQPGSKSYEEWLEQLTAMYNMDKGIIAGYFGWIGQVFRGEFGDSWHWTRPVLEVFKGCVGLSFVMGGIALFFELIIAIPLGLIAGTHKNKLSDNIISAMT